MEPESMNPASAKEKKLPFKLGLFFVLVGCMLAASVCCLVLADTPATLCANSQIDISDANMKKLEDQLAALEKSDKDLKSKINKAESSIVEQKNLKSYLDTQISLTEQKIENTNNLIIEYQNVIRMYGDAIAEMEQTVASRYQQVLDLLCLSYEESKYSYFEIILGTTSFSDFLMSVERVGSLLEYQNQEMLDLNDQIDLLNLLKEQNETNQLRTEELTVQLAQAEKDLEKQKKDADDAIAKANSTKSQATATIANNQKAREELDKMIEEILLERQRQSNANYIGGDLGWPLDVTKWTRVSSGFGYRTYDKQVHRGIDIPADYGEPVYAANGGTVVTATLHNSYGYFVLIDHGGGIATLYAHNSKLLVSEGDVVKAGQQIAQVGSTGDSSGNHCHFEVRVNGVCKNPLDGEYPSVVAPGS